jgi:ATP-dependent helicase/nuclease subunit B
MRAFVDELAEVCRREPTRAKWVIVPTHSLGRTLAERLVREGTPWANLRFVTPLDLALRMGAPYLIERGIDPSEDQLGPALMMRLLLGLDASHQYFRPLAHEPQLASALWATVRELRLAGLSSAELRAEQFESAAKHAELQALFAAYEAHLAAHNLGDQASVYTEALAHPEWCPIKADDWCATVPGVRWSVLQERVMGSTGLKPYGHVQEGGRGPTVAGGSTGGSTGLKPCGHVQEGGRGPTVAGGATGGSTGLKPYGHVHAIPHFFTAGGPEAEVEEVVRRILASGRRLDEVEIACASHGYETLIWEKACRYEWPVTLQAGLPATLTRPGRALLAVLEWIEGDFAAGQLRRLLQSGDLTEIPKSAARLLLRADAAWGRETYALSLGRLATSSRARATEDIGEDERAYHLKRADEADALAAWIDGLISTIPAADANGVVDLQPLVEAMATLVSDRVARHSALDHAAADRLATSLRELRALGEFRCPLAQVLRFVRSRAEALVIGADRARPGHLHVSRLTDAGWSHRPLTFIVGLEEGRVFAPPVEDPILLDRERTALSPALLTSAQRLAEQVDRTLARVNDVLESGESVHLSYSCRDLRQFRATYASWVMLHAFRSTPGHESATYKDLHTAVGDPVSVVPSSPDAAPGAGRWWLHASAHGGPSAREVVLDAFPHLAQGERAEAARDSDRFTEFDGHVPEAGAALDPAQPDMVVSPTQLEGAAACPFRHFLRRGLGVDAIETGERDRDIWLNPLIRGSLLHDLYAEFHDRCLKANRQPEEGDVAWLLERGQATLDDTTRTMPPPSVEVGAREAAEFLEDLTIFARAEIETAGTRRPVECEAPFDNHVVSAGDITFRIRGRIDRIDEMPDGTFEILDYKTGSFFAPAWKGTFAGGRRLQHALYGLAAADLLRRRKDDPSTPMPTVTGATYYFSSTKGRQHQKHLDAPSKADLAKVMGDLRDVIAQGLFVHSPDEDDCRFCDYGAACGVRAVKRAEAKKNDPALHSFLRLSRYE